MLDETSGRLLEALTALGEGGGYKVVEEEELMRLVPANADEIARRMAYLEDRRLIDLRYAEAGEYCVRVLAAGRSYGAAAALEKREEKRERRDLLLVSFFGAFAGGAAAAALMLLLSLAV